jgi:hypothetical protein
MRTGYVKIIPILTFNPCIDSMKRDCNDPWFHARGHPSNLSGRNLQTIQVISVLLQTCLPPIDVMPCQYPQRTALIRGKVRFVKLK